jgi:hypothetical protein
MITRKSVTSQTRADRAANDAATFDPGSDPARREDGDHDLYPNITIDGAMVFAYAEGGVLTVSVDLDDALAGESPVWAAYGPAGDQIPLRITVQGTDVFRAEPDAAPHGDHGGIVLTRAQLRQWTGMDLTPAETARLARCIPGSSIPDAIGTIVTEAMGLHRNEEDEDD